MHKLKNTSEFVCSITLCGRLFHIGTTEKKNEFLTTSTRANFKVSFFEWEFLKPLYMFLSKDYSIWQ